MVFLWIPSHICEPYHDATDQAAKDATDHPKVTNNLHLTHTTSNNGSNFGKIHNSPTTYDK